MEDEQLKYKRKFNRYLRNLQPKGLVYFWTSVFAKLQPGKYRNATQSTPSARADSIGSGLIAILEDFLCNGQPLEVMLRFRELSQPPAVCGHVFNLGEPTYTCKDCSMDATCVLCLKCFRKSIHKTHKYKISNSNGGGCCDCGDVEAWKSHPYCDDHVIGTLDMTLDPDNTDADINIPQEFLRRAEYIFKCIVWYSFTLLCSDHIVMPQGLKQSYSKRKKLKSKKKSSAEQDDNMLVGNEDGAAAADVNLADSEDLAFLVDCNSSGARVARATSSTGASSSRGDGNNESGGNDDDGDEVDDDDDDEDDEDDVDDDDEKSEDEHDDHNYDFDDKYCPVIYNDEQHTFDQVINTIIKVFKCDQMSASNLVTNIDREGRAIFDSCRMQKCTEVKQEIERYLVRQGIRSLKVLIVSTEVIVNQNFAMKLLEWLYVFLNNGEVFRNLFTKVLTEPDSDLLSLILLSDSHMWKSARAHFHRLIIAGMLKEYELKKTFANTFIKHYANMIDGFLNDDQDQMYSAISLSVQIFTVPTIAHYLIAEKNALSILLSTFYDTYATRINSRGKFEFDRSHSNMPMKRAQCILTDVKYLIKLMPTVWTEPLRANFLNGFRKLLQLLSAIQGMDQLVRQTGQHMEFEPEWEPAFNLHVRLAKVLPLFIEWCGSDRYVLVRAYNKLVQHLVKTMPTEWFEKYTIAQLGDAYAQCIDYHVAVQPVSIHLPLSRLFAGLYLHLHKYQLTFESPEIAQNDKITPVHLMEAVLETQVMIAQVHAGLWRRNGYSLTNQLYFYQIPKFRSEMLDRDIMMLQICASLMNANEFMLNVLNKFTLLSWLSTDFPANMQSPSSSSGTGTGTATATATGSGTAETSENSSSDNTTPAQTSIQGRIHQIFSANEDSLKNLIDVIEEFLKLIIIVVGERHVPGISYVTEADRMKKELIQQLCVKSLAHSEVYRSSVDDLVDDAQFETVINEIADFKGPKSLISNKGGVYELKDEYYDHFNVFYYHYFKEDFSKSEVQIRKRRKAKNELECCPPPKLPRLRPEFNYLVCLLDCDVTMQLLKTIMERTLDLQTRDFSELQIHMVLHLIGYGLLEQQTGWYPGFQFVQKARRYGIFDMLRKLVGFKRVEIHEGLCQWLLEKYREVARDIDGQTSEQTKDTEKGSNAMETECESTAGRVDASDKSPVAGPSGEQQSSAAESRAKMVAESRARIMAQFKAMQNRFMNDNQNLLDENAHESSSTSGKPSTTQAVAYDFGSDANDFPVALGPRKSPSLKDDPVLQCILCQEEHRNNSENSELVFAAFVQQSTVLSKNRNCADTHEVERPHVLTSVMHRVPHTNTCGHIMHYRCWKLHFDNLVYKENRRSYRLRQVSSFNLEKREFLCPLCECLSNTIMPIVPSLADMELLPSLSCDSFKIWIDIMRNEFDQYELPINTELDAMYQKYDNFEMKPNLKLTYNLAENVQIYGNTVLMIGLEKTNVEKSAPIDPRTPLLIWKSCAYTIHSFEALLRQSKKSLMGDWSARQKDCMENVIKVSRICASAFLTNDRKVLNRYNMFNIPILYNYLALLFKSDGLCVSRDTKSGQPLLSFLEYDSFGFLVAFQFLTNTFMGTNLTDNWLLKLMLIKQIVYILVVTELPEMMSCDDENGNGNQPQPQPSLAGFESIRHLLAMIHEHRKEKSPFNFHTVDFVHLQEILKSNLRPFLRASALFYKFLNNIPIPEPFLEVDADHFDNLCQFLGIEPDFDKIIEKDVFPLVETWLRHKFVRDYFERKVDMNMVPKNLIEINHLIELPDDFTELISKVSTFTCPRNKNENSRTPTMCLVCGEILCSQSYCCQSRSSVVKEGVGMFAYAHFTNNVLITKTPQHKTKIGACTKHSLECGAGSGLFLRIRDCELIILSNITRGCYQVPPYLDEYSEPDQGLVRGYPLKLCGQNYERYNSLWFSHALHEEVTRVIESTVNYLPNPWHNL